MISRYIYIYKNITNFFIKYILKTQTNTVTNENTYIYNIEIIDYIHNITKYINIYIYNIKQQCKCT